MAHDKIWDYFQNESPETFRSTESRLGFLARRIAAPARVLDVGVGVGIFEREAIARGLDVWCLDPSERSIEALRERFGLGDKARVGDGAAMPFEDGAFDAVVMSEVLEHLPDDVLARTLDEVWRVLKPSGRFLGTVPCRENLAAQTVVCPCCGERFHRWGHVQRFDPERLRATLGKRLEVLRIEERRFAAWHTLNWKGKLAAAAQLALLRLGVHGRNESLFFEAQRP